MVSNDQIILNHLLEQEKDRVAANLDDSTFFELFAVGQVLKNYDLSYDEIESGLVGDGNDGGIDAIYAFANGELVSDDTEIDSRVQDITIQLAIIQSKVTRSFSETAVERLISTTRDLLDLSHALGDLRTAYNDNLIRVADNFRRIYMSVMSRFPQLSISYYYATKGTHVHPNVKRKVNVLEEEVGRLFSAAEFSFAFLGARELLDLASRSPTECLDLVVAETPISTGDRGFICLVHLRDYFSFITDPKKDLRRGIFEANVRDYQGAVEVNREIKKTLEEPGDEDFWWLNNGITVVATKAALAGKTLTVEQPQIVNGLQTSLEIYKYFRDKSDKVDHRKVLVRVIVTTDETSQNNIIKATNNQIRMPAASLRATDPFQRDIEMYLRTRGLFYDRRKNYYKNLGKPKDKIISIPYLAQSVMAVVLQEPNNARGRPTTLIKDDEDYERLFNPEYPIPLFFECGHFMKTVDDFLRSSAPEYARHERSNLRFHLAMFAGAIKAGQLDMRPKDIPNIGLDGVDFSFLVDCLDHVWDVFEELKSQEDSDRASDRIAKSHEFDDALRERLQQIFEGQMFFEES